MGSGGWGAPLRENKEEACRCWDRYRCGPKPCGEREGKVAGQEKV